VFAAPRNASEAPTKNASVREDDMPPLPTAGTREILLPTETEGEKPFRVCGQVFATYIVVERAGEMLLIDQHAAHERLGYERLLTAWRARKISPQTLLLPVTVELSGAEAACFAENAEFFSEIGFEIENFGERALLARAAPEAFAENEIRALVLEILEGLSQNRRDVMASRMERALYQTACKAAVKANRTLAPQEIEALLQALFALPNYNTCPHGRPITIAFSQTFIEKQFKRIV
jgi:DNA mismatch repair protein MutL